MEDTIPDVLYHYCSVDTFKIIAEKKTLRLSEIAKSNDSMECRWMEKVIVPSMIEEYARNIISKSNLELIEDVNTREEEINKYVYTAVQYLDDFFNGDAGLVDTRVAFATCFSQKQDLLSQWRGYANDGSGVAIGFDTGIFKPYIDTRPIFYNLKKIIYNKREQQQLIRKHVKKYVETLLLEKKVINKDAVVDLIVESAVSSVYIKNPAFSEEAEWRFFISSNKTKSFSDLQNTIKALKIEDKFSPVSVFVRGDKAIFYMDMQLEKQDNTSKPISWIKEVVLGPKCKLSIRDVLLMLECFNWSVAGVNIVRSKATYN